LIYPILLAIAAFSTATQVSQVVAALEVLALEVGGQGKVERPVIFQEEKKRECIIVVNGTI